MHRATALLLILACGLSQAVDETKNTVPGIEPRIVGGQPATDGQFPSQVSLKVADLFYCSGVLVAEDKVLTVSNCLENVTAEHIQVGAGSVNKADHSATEMMGSSYALHDNVGECPLGILTLATKFDLNGTKIKTLKLADEDKKAGTACTVGGWGDDNAVGGYSDTLLYADVSILDKDTCAKQYSSLGGQTLIGNGMVCVGSNKGACLTDIGGPLICDNSITGIVAAATCGSTILPSVYVDAYYCRGWVNSQINSAGILSKQSLVIYALFVLLTRWISRS